MSRRTARDSYADGVIGEVRRDVHPAAANAGATAVPDDLCSPAVGHAAGVVLVGVPSAPAAVGPALDVRRDVAADDEELVVRVRYAEHALQVKLHGGLGFVRAPVAGPVVAGPGNRQLHSSAGRHHGQVQDLVARAGEEWDAAVARDLEAGAEAVGADAKRVGDVDAAACSLAVGQCPVLRSVDGRRGG